MPKISSNKTYGGEAGTADARLTFRERLMKRFAAHDWVRVINPDNEAFTWQYLPAHAEDFEFTPDPMKITRRGEVEPYALDPGESEVIIGENAYVMIEALYKKLITKKFIITNGPPKYGDPGRNFNWTDGVQQEKLIDRIFLGIENPSFDNVPSKKAPVSAPKQPTTTKKKAPVRLRQV